MYLYYIKKSIYDLLISLAIILRFDILIKLYSLRY